MTLVAEQAESAEATWSPRRVRGRGTWGWLPETSLAVAVGLLLISISYAGGRAGATWAAAPFWAGQIIMFLPPLVRLLTARLVREREGFGIATVLALGYFAQEYCFSPVEFKFIDELQHWRTAADILISGHLFGYNYSLPISPLYPGQESITTALVQLTGLNIVASGITLMCAARLLLTIALYLVFRRIGSTPRVAGLASVLFTTAPYYKTILAKFIYTNVALPFFVLAIYAAVRIVALPPGRSRRCWWAVGVTSIAVTVITHHVTSWILAGVLLLSLAAFLFNRNVVAVRHLAGLSIVCIGLIGLWIGLVAPGTLAYLRPAVTDVVAGVSNALLGRVQQSDGGFLRDPLPDAVASYSSVIVIACCLPLGCLWIWRRRRTNSWMLAMAAGALVYLAIPVVRVVSTAGSEDAVRALNYLYMPIGFVLATVVAALLARRVRRRLVVAGCAALAMVIMIGGVTSGWPPYWGRIPSDRMIVDGYENAVEPEGVAAAYWTQELIAPGSRMTADDTNYTLMGPYGQQNMVRGTAPIYLSDGFGQVARDMIVADQIQFVVADRRLSEQLPAGGSYFPDDPRAYRYTTPLSPEALTKFDHVPEISRTFDSGNIVIYDVRGVRDDQ